MSEFFAMGGYAAYVWPSFGLTAIVMLSNLYFAKRRRNKIIATLQRAGIQKDSPLKDSPLKDSGKSSEE